jgi:aminomethyltransferase
VKLEKGDFVGREALRTWKASPGRSRVGLRLDGKRIARQGTPVVQGAREVGTVTSGTFAPTLQTSLAMALVDPDSARPGTQLALEIRGQADRATVIELPFYRRPKAKA